MKDTSIILMKDWKPLINALPESDRCYFFDLLFEYEYGVEQVCERPMVFPVWTFVRSQLDKMKEKYDNVCEKNRINGMKGGRPTNQNKPKETEQNRTVILETEKTLNDNDKDNNKDNGNDKDKEKDNNNDIILSEINSQKTEILSLEIEKEKERKKLAPKKERNLSELQYPYLSESFINTWDVLINEPKWRKKTTSALQASLVQLSKYSEQIAIEMMLQSISGNYQGLFEIKKSNNGKSNSEIDSYNADLEKRAKQLADNIGF